ncbi:MAG TPA: hypothetical protein VFB31_11585 [Pseudolabrys sp.]|nr:hypothetical protein [Pseudolabrys sp.]
MTMDTIAKLPFRAWPGGADLKTVAADALMLEYAQTARWALSILALSKKELVARCGTSDAAQILPVLGDELLRTAENLENLAAVARAAHARLLVSGAAVLATADVAPRARRAA